ncbi:MAG: hypothetical protein GX879_00585 [Bacteroidales bacterium]|nr:hypothetical protein [Bacteroidales bacterium]
MKYLAVILFSIFSLSVFSQVNQSGVPDSRLFEKYSVEYLNLLKPDAIDYMNFELDNGYEIITLKLEKAQQFPKLRYYDSQNKQVGDFVTNIDESNVNIMLYDYERYYDKPKIYQIGDTEKIISFKSLRELNDKFNEN